MASSLDISEAMGNRLTEAQIQVLYTRGMINHATWTNALHAFHGDSTAPLGQEALKTCELAIEALVTQAVDAVCVAIQDKLGIRGRDGGAEMNPVLSDAVRNYVYAKLEIVL